MVETGGVRCSAPLRRSALNWTPSSEHRARERETAAAVSAHAALLSRSQLHARASGDVTVDASAPVAVASKAQAGRRAAGNSANRGGWCQRLTDRGSQRVTRPSRRPARPPFIRSWRGRDTGRVGRGPGAQPPPEEEEEGTCVPSCSPGSGARPVDCGCLGWPLRGLSSRPCFLRWRLAAWRR